MAPQSNTQASQKPTFDYWEAAKKELLATPNLLNRMLAYDKENISDSVMLELKLLISNPEFQPEQVKKSSVAAGRICQWIHAMVVYHRIAKELQPKKLRIMAAETAVARAAGDLAIKKVAVDVAYMDPLTGEGVARAAVLPMLTSAACELDLVNKKDIVEIKSMCAPPQPVMIVCMCVVILQPLGKMNEDAGWATAKKMLANPHLLDSLRKFNKDGVNEGQIKKIRNLLAREEKLFVGEYMKCVSKACYGLLQWVLAMVRYFEVMHSVGAKRNISKDLLMEDGPADKALTIKTQMDAQLSKAMPAMEAANAAHSCVTKSMIQELKSLQKPPAEVAEVFSVVAFLLGSTSKNVDWKAAQKMMSNPSQFLNELAEFDANSIPHKVLSECEPIVTQPFFTFDVMKKKSMAAAHLANWVLNVIAYNRMYSNVAPSMAILKDSDAPNEAPDGPLQKYSVAKNARQLEKVQKHLPCCITKGDITELKCLANPPYLVLYTMEALSMIIQGRESSWNEAKALLNDTQLLPKCLSVCNSYADPAIVEKLEAYISNPTFTPECVGKVSKAAVGVCRLVHDTYNRARANMDDASTASPPSPQSLDLSHDLEFCDSTPA